MMEHIKQDLFWRMVRKWKKCWLYLGYKNRNGYGEYNVRGYGPTLAHRISYFYANGEFDNSLIVRHKCDNPACVNPSHLELGTHFDNVQDRVQRGRSASRSNGRWRGGRESVGSRRKLGEYATQRILELRTKSKFADQTNISAICDKKEIFL